MKTFKTGKVVKLANGETLTNNWESTYKVAVKFVKKIQREVVVVNIRSKIGDSFDSSREMYEYATGSANKEILGRDDQGYLPVEVSDEVDRLKLTLPIKSYFKPVRVL